jgi:hypothetical protein
MKDFLLTADKTYPYGASRNKAAFCFFHVRFISCSCASSALSGQAPP